MSAASLCPAVSISDVMNKAGLYGKRISQSQANLFCSSMVKSDLTWLHPEEIMFEAKKYFVDIDINKTIFVGIYIDGTILYWYRY